MTETYCALGVAFPQKEMSLLASHVISDIRASRTNVTVDWSLKGIR